MELIKNILAGISVIVMLYVVTVLIYGATGIGFIFALPVYYMMLMIGAIGISIAAVLLLTRKISTTGANFKTIRRILLLGLLVFILIILKTFWTEFFR